MNLLFMKPDWSVCIRDSKTLFILLSLLLKCVKGESQFIHGSSGIPDFVRLGEIEIRGFVWECYEKFLS